MSSLQFDNWWVITLSQTFTFSFDARARPGAGAYPRSRLLAAAGAGAAAALLVLGASAAPLGDVGSRDPRCASGQCRSSSSRSLDATLRLKAARPAATRPAARVPASGGAAPPARASGLDTRVTTDGEESTTDGEESTTAAVDEEAMTTVVDEEAATTEMWFMNRLEGESCGWWGSKETYKGECAPGLRCAPQQEAAEGAPNVCVSDQGASGAAPPAEDAVV
ncbi:unnamed protein product [Prorocentrum cordatum]|uniref:Cellulase n=1 Tax=Prorocentrum cordatum TaxID=2364126 RepID=A0ABN9PZF9_9DINO|nr:unnamed protein product [Polarella glacialis]